MTAALTLTEFLLARIAEDEEFARAGINLRSRVSTGGMTARQVAHAGSLFDLVIDDGDVMSSLRPYGATGVRAPGEAERILAECEAKRRIVDACRGDYEDGARYGHVDYTNAAAFEVMQSLALPYADHPDMRPEWLP